MENRSDTSAQSYYNKDNYKKLKSWFKKVSQLKQTVHFGVITPYLR